MVIQVEGPFTEMLGTRSVSGSGAFQTLKYLHSILLALQKFQIWGLEVFNLCGAEQGAQAMGTDRPGGERLPCYVLGGAQRGSGKALTAAEDGEGSLERGRKSSFLGERTNQCWVQRVSPGRC